MAKKRIVTLLDEWDGRTTFTPGEGGVEDLTFIVDGKIYQLDLSNKSLAAFKANIDPWIEKAREDGIWVNPKVLNAFYARVRKFGRENPIGGTKVSPNGKPQKVYLDKYAANFPEDPNPLGNGTDDDDTEE